MVLLLSAARDETYILGTSGYFVKNLRISLCMCVCSCVPTGVFIHSILEPYLIWPWYFPLWADASCTVSGIQNRLSESRFLFVSCVSQEACVEGWPVRKKWFWLFISQYLPVTGRKRWLCLLSQFYLHLKLAGLSREAFVTKSSPPLHGRPLES